MFTLYYAPGACSLATHIVLEELGLPYEAVKLNLMEGDQRKPEFLALNPRGRVPVLSVDGKVMTESLAILTFLAGGHPKGGLWPEETWDQAQALRNMAFFSSTVHIAYANMIRPARFCSDESTHEAIKASGRESFWKYLEEIDGMLTAKDWVMGKQYTVCDPYALVFYRWGKRSGMAVEQLGNYSKLVLRLMDRPAAKRAFDMEGIKHDLT
jgi:glutathione S-transferase